MSNMSAFEKGMNGLVKDHSIALTKVLAKVFGFDVKEALQLVEVFLQSDKKEKKKAVRKEKPVETEEEKKMIGEKADEVMKVMGLSKKKDTEKKKVVRKGKSEVVVNLSPILEEEPIFKDDSDDELCMKDIDGKHYFVNESNGNIHEVTGDCEAGEVVGIYKDDTPVFKDENLVFNKEEPKKEEPKKEEPKKKKSVAKKVEKNVVKKVEEKDEENVVKKA